MSSRKVLFSSTHNNLDVQKHFGSVYGTNSDKSLSTLGFTSNIELDGGKIFKINDTCANDENINRHIAINSFKSYILPQTLLQDIRKRKSVHPETWEDFINNCNYKDEQLQDVHMNYHTDMEYKFHIHEKLNDSKRHITTAEDECFAGYKDIMQNRVTIRSAKGTIRGVKNRVREGIATFLYINSSKKNYQEKEAGKVVVYTTTIGILRETYQACMKVKQILRTQLVKFEERDVFMSSEYQAEIRERMYCNHILVPQVFANGHHIGDADTIEKLNESGELRRILEPFKSMDILTTCPVCGGYRLLPCQICKGSKKSVHRNHFTTEFVALKCMNCDEVGLVRCTSCS